MSEVLVSVLLPVYNGERFLAEAIESVLNQSHSNLELILMDDGSSDNSLSIIRRYEKIDPRVRVYSRENKGLVITLNEGVAHAEGGYIARMDADDICYQDRLEIQLKKMLDDNLNVVGGKIDLFEEEEITGSIQYREENDDIKASIITWERNFCHPAVLVKKSVYEKYPYEDYPGIEDFVLWIRLALDKKIKMGNLQSPVLKYREHAQQVTQNGKNRYWHLANQLKTMQDVVCDTIEGVSREDVKSFEKLMRSRKRYIRREDKKRAFGYIDKIMSSDCLTQSVKEYFLAVTHARLKKKSRPKNKQLLLMRLKSRLKKLGREDLAKNYRLNA